MSAYDLIPEETYANLPEEDADKFVTLVRTAQSNLQRMLDDSNARDFSDELRSQFMATIQGIAEALGVTGLSEIRPTIEYGDYTRFQVILAGIVAKTRLRSDVLAKPHSVALGRVTRAKIRQEVEQLRTYVDEADLTPAKRAALNDKLDELLAELEHRRLSFAKTMAIAASIMGTIGGTAGAIAASPKIPAGISFIISLVGQDKEQEDAEIARLAPPPLAIAAPKQAPSSTGGYGGGYGFSHEDLDDDVPF
ncbi:hypothetical protein [Sphingomonas sp. RIT328]|uniref:hypothetical protein n=1 Tax=Sphingomonas sp. RIT328 TaxID=1470591 RepID=UPI00044DD253|nr:hypothetical protein [Sphingomonas sp. RIT328]EZP57280.1 hypothetical protein BW41_00123 [Sphingomonas sp. RIT328]